MTLWGEDEQRSEWAFAALRQNERYAACEDEVNPAPVHRGLPLTTHFKRDDGRKEKREKCAIFRYNKKTLSLPDGAEQQPVFIFLFCRWPDPGTPTRESNPQDRHPARPQCRKIPPAKNRWRSPALRLSGRKRSGQNIWPYGYRSKSGKRQSLHGRGQLRGFCLSEQLSGRYSTTVRLSIDQKVKNKPLAQWWGSVTKVLKTSGKANRCGYIVEKSETEI